MCAAVLILTFIRVKGVQELITVSKCQRDSKVYAGLVFVCVWDSAVSLSQLSLISQLSDTA